jgi:hypothetical protein
MEKETWITEVYNSTKGKTLVVPDDTLFSKIQNKIRKENTVAPQWIWLAAASLAILISLNIKIIFKKTNSETSKTETVFHTLSKTNQLY